MIDVLRRNPGFRRLWAAQVVSQLGDWMSRVAILALIADLSGAEGLHALGALVALEFSLRMLPSVVFGPLAGPLADRLPRRALMIVADVARAAIVAAMIFVDEAAELPLLYALLFLQTSVSTFFQAARSAATPSTLERNDLQAGYAITTATWSTMLAVGAALGGWLVGPLGIRGVLVVDVATYLLSALCLRSLRLPPVPVHPQPFRWRDVVTLTELRRAHVHARDRHLLPAVYAKLFWGAAGGFLVMFTIAATVRFGLDDAGVPVEALVASATGSLYLARGIGTGVGPVLSRTLFPGTARSLRRQISGGFLVAFLGYLPFATADTLTVAFVVVVLSHLGGGVIWVSSTVLWQQDADDAFRGRLSALESATLTLGMSAGAFLSGSTFDATGSVEFATYAACALVAIGGGSWTWWSRSTRHPSERTVER